MSSQEAPKDPVVLYPGPILPLDDFLEPSLLSPLRDNCQGHADGDTGASEYPEIPFRGDPLPMLLRYTSTQEARASSRPLGYRFTSSDTAPRTTARDLMRTLFIRLSHKRVVVCDR